MNLFYDLPTDIQNYIWKMVRDMQYANVLEEMKFSTMIEEKIADIGFKYVVFICCTYLGKPYYTYYRDKILNSPNHHDDLRWIEDNNIRNYCKDGIEYNLIRKCLMGIDLGHYITSS